MRALERACVGLGVGFQEGTEVLALRRGSGGALTAVELRTAEGERLQRPCSTAVLACAPGAPGCCRSCPCFR